MTKTVRCQRCGRTIESVQAVVEAKGENEIIILCKECINLYGHCHTCSMFGPCAFFEDGDPMPQFVVVTQQIKQGNATFIQQRQIPNPERAKKFCENGECKCLHTFEDGTKLCCRHSPYATCTNYAEEDYKKFVQNFPVETESEN